MRHKIYLNIQSFISDLVLNMLLYGKYVVIETNVDLNFHRRFVSIDEYVAWATKQVLIDLKKYTKLLTDDTTIQDLYLIMDQTRNNDDVIFDIEHLIRSIVPFSLYMDSKDNIYESYFELIECYLEDLLLFKSYSELEDVQIEPAKVKIPLPFKFEPKILPDVEIESDSDTKPESELESKPVDKPVQDDLDSEDSEPKVSPIKVKFDPEPESEPESDEPKFESKFESKFEKVEPEPESESESDPESDFEEPKPEKLKLEEPETDSDSEFEELVKEQPKLPESEQPKLPEPEQPKLPEPEQPKLPEPEQPKLPEPEQPKISEPEQPKLSEPEELDSDSDDSESDATTTTKRKKIKPDASILLKDMNGQDIEFKRQNIRKLKNESQENYLKRMEENLRVFFMDMRSKNVIIARPYIRQVFGSVDRELVNQVLMSITRDMILGKDDWKISQIDNRIIKEFLLSKGVKVDRMATDKKAKEIIDENMELLTQ